MMKKKCFLLFLITIPMMTFTQNTKIIVTPHHPQYFQPITIRYQNPIKNQNPESVTLNYFTSLLSGPKLIPMKAKNGFWETQITIKDTSIKMILFAFAITDSSGDRSLENNDSQYWDFLMAHPTGKPVQSSHQTRALTYTGYGEKRSENLDMAIEEIEQELILYPTNYRAKNLHYSVLLKKFNYSKTIRDQIQNEINEMVEAHPNQEQVLNFTSKIYRMIGEIEKAQKIETRLITQHPQSSKAAVKQLNAIMKLDEEESQISRLEQFLNEFPNSPLIEVALSRLISLAIMTNDSIKLIETGDLLLNVAKTPAGASGLSAASGVLAEKNIEIDRAITYVKKALTLSHSMDSITVPPEVSPQEWGKNHLKTIGRYRDILGWAYLRKGKLNPALNELKAAAESVMQPAIYSHLAEAYKIIGQIDSALIYFSRTALFGGEIGDQAMLEFQSLWKTTGKNETLMENFLNQERTWIEQTRTDNILSHRSIRKAPDFELQDIQGNNIRLSNQQESVILLCFWASWSESSKRLLTVLDHLVKQYGQEVLFLTVAMDPDLSEVKKAIKKERMALPVLLNNNTDRLYQLTGVPTTYLIDKEGNIHFEHRGNPPDIQALLAVEIEDLL